MSIFSGVLLGAGELCLFLLEERPQMLLSISCREGSCFFTSSGAGGKGIFTGQAEREADVPG